MPNLGEPDYQLDLETLCQRAVDYSSGHIIDINIEYFGTDDLLHRIANSASHLQRLRLASCWSISDEGLCDAAEKFPRLEELDISISNLSARLFEAIGRCCPQLKTLKFNSQGYRHPHIEYDDDDDDAYDNNDEAFAIAKYMPGLRHLQLIGNEMTNDGLVALLDGCPHLESLDIRRCFNVNLVGTLGKRCKEQIKYFRLPHDATDDYPFQTSECDDYGSPVEDDADESDLMSDYGYDYDYEDYDDFLGEGDFSDDNPYGF